MKLEGVKILGVPYSITYCDKPSDVDIHKRESLWGQCDYWTRNIRVYDGGRCAEDILETIIHEILHAIGEAFKLDILDKGRGEDADKHEELGVLALALMDVFLSNGLIKLE